MFTPTTSEIVYHPTRSPLLIWFLALVGILCSFSVYATASTTYYAASYNGSNWSWYANSTGGTASSTTPTRTGGNLSFSTLTSGGPTTYALNSTARAVLSNSGATNYTNTITGNILVSGGASGKINRVWLDNQSSGTTTNNITGNLMLSDYSRANLMNSGSGSIINTVVASLICNGNSESAANFFNDASGSVTNTIAGGITVSGGSSENFYNNGSGSVTNTITGGITASNGGSVSFTNNGSGSVANTINGGITLSGSNSAGDFINTSTGTTTSTIDTVNVTNGTLYLGGGGSTTNIDTLNWNGGNVKLLYANSAFGITHINNLNVTGAVNLTLLNPINWQSLTTFNGSQSLLTFDNFTGNASNITLVNTSPFTEVVNTNGSSNGISINGTTVTVSLAPTASAHNPADIETIQSPTDMPVTIVANEIANQFAPTPYQKAEAGARIQKALQQRKGGDSFENLLSALSEGGDSTKFVKIAGDYRVFAAP